jgi:hypothetical protein
VKSVGPEELPEVSFSSGKIRMTTPAGIYAGHSTTLARATLTNTARQAITAMQARRDFIFMLLICPLQNRESALHSVVLAAARIRCFLVISTDSSIFASRSDLIQSIGDLIVVGTI